MDNKKERILVIGSQNHKSADCISWIQPLDKVYIGNYDIIIIYTPSLNKEILTRMEKESNRNLELIREDILESLSFRKKLFICISSPYITTGTVYISSGGDEIPADSNYGWCPVDLIMKNKTVTTINYKKEFIPKYMQHVKSCNFYFDYNINMAWLESNRKTNVKVKWNHEIDSIVENGVGKPLAFKITLKPSVNIKNTWVDIEKYSPIIFIPPLTAMDASEGINILIKDIKGLEEKIDLPEWANDIKLPSEENLIKENEKDKEKIDLAQKNTEKRNLEIEKLNRYKALLTTTGLLLEELVEEALNFLGIKLLNQKIQLQKIDL